MQLAGLEGQRLGPGKLLELRLRVLAHPFRRPHEQHLDLTAGVAQMARRHDAVGAVVALAADDGDPSRRGAPRHHLGEALARPLHQFLAGDALLGHRPAIEFFGLARLEQRIHPAWKAHSRAKAIRPAPASDLAGAVRLPPRNSRGAAHRSGRAGGYAANPLTARRCDAACTASSRELTPSLRYTFFMCERTVSGESTSSRAIPSVVVPAPSRSSTSHSRSVSAERTGRMPVPPRGVARYCSTSCIASRREIAASPSSAPRNARGRESSSTSLER